MSEKITNILKTNHILSHFNQGIRVCLVADAQAGIDLVKKILYAIVDKRTILYLSGGSLKSLYETLASEGEIIPGAVGLVDERYGEKFHANSNEKMIQDTHFLRYLQARDIPFYSVLQNKSRVETAEDCDKRFREMNMIYPQSIGLLGIGSDGHTSSLAPNRKDFTNPMLNPSHKQLMVDEFNDPKSNYKERVGMTFLGLSMLDILIVPVFGSGKQIALEAMFSPPAYALWQAQGEEELPAKFYLRPEIAKKTLLITDQQI